MKSNTDPFLRTQKTHFWSKLNLGYRIFLAYLLVGLLPMSMICFSMINGTNQILVEQTKNKEKDDLMVLRNRVSELEETLTTASELFYFDEQLEKIALHSYEDYQELLEDYYAYSNFIDYQKYYNTMIYRIGIFLENDTIISNQAFRLVDEKVMESEWYQRACEANGKVIWDYLPYLKSGQEKNGFALARMLHNKKGENVGVLAIYLQQEWLDHLLQDRNGETYLFLNDEEVVSSAGDEGLNVDTVRQFLGDTDAEEYQTQVQIDGEEFILTCVKAVQDHVEDQLAIVSVRRVSEILKEDQEQNRRSLAILIISNTAILCLIALFAWSYNRKIEKFKSQMQKAAEGNFELVEHIGGTDEISQLYEYLNTMILQIRQLLTEIYQEKIHAEQLKNKQKDAEFKMLTSQINPHFLYNTLETIRMKARVNQQYEIEDLVKMLGKLLRSSIQAGVEETTIGEEMELVECYLKIQQYRFGQRLNYRIEVDEGLKQQPILPLVLQPMAENAIIHGLEEKMDDGHLEIKVSRYENEIRMVVEDDGPGISGEKLAEIQEDLKNRRVKGRHIGISNVHQRLVMRYGEEYGVSIESVVGCKTRVILRLPYQKNE